MGSIRVTFGTGGNLQDKTVKSTQIEQTITADEGYNGINEVTVEPFLLQNKTVIPNLAQQNIVADNGFDGLGTVTVEAKSNDVILQEKEIVPTNEPQEITADVGYDALSKVIVDRIPVWEPDPDWWDIRAIVRADVQSGYTYKSIFLIDDTYDDSYLTYGFDAYKTSDGEFYANNTTRHIWDKTQDKPYSLGKTRWIIAYTNSPGSLPVAPFNELLYVDCYTVDGSFFNKFYNRFKLQAIEGNFNQSNSNTGTLYNYFTGCNSLVKVGFVEFNTTNSITMSNMCNGCSSLREFPEIVDCTNCTSINYMFSNCNSLVKSPVFQNTESITNASYLYFGCHSLYEVQELVNLSACTDIAGMFYECKSLLKYPTMTADSINNCTDCFNKNSKAIKLPELDYSNISILNSLFSDCRCLAELQDLDLSSCTQNNYMTYYLLCLKKLPKILIPSTAPTGVTINFQVSTGISDKNSVATFDELGNIVDGMVYYLNTMNSARALTLNANIKALFTADEQTAIQTLVTSKNWTLVW